MLKTIKINLIIIVFFIFIIEFFIITFNYIFGGVPIYRQFNISVEEVVSYKQAKYKNGDIIKLDEVYIKSFNNLDKKSFLKEYKRLNNLNNEKIFYIKGADINFPFFVDKNLCRENKDSNYIYSDTVLIGDSFLFGISIASPFDIVGRLRQLNSDKIYLNLGMPGTDPRQQVNHLKKHTKKTEFENLVWLFAEANDYELNESLIAECGYKNKEPNSLERKYNVNKSSLLPIKIFLAEHLRGLASFSKLFISYDNKFNLNKKIYEKTVKDLSIYLDQKGVKKRILYYLPTYNRHSYKTNFIIHPNVRKLNVLKKNVKIITTKYGFEFIDGDEAVKDIKNKFDLYHYGYPTHYNSIGYTLSADHLNFYLNNR